MNFLMYMRHISLIGFISFQNLHYICFATLETCCPLPHTCFFSTYLYLAQSCFQICASYQGHLRCSSARCHFTETNQANEQILKSDLLCVRAGVQAEIPASLCKCVNCVSCGKFLISLTVYVWVQCFVGGKEFPSYCFPTLTQCFQVKSLYNMALYKPVTYRKMLGVGRWRKELKVMQAS